ncbi:MAG: transglutaminase-like domain-containing protein, partial [Candidatus Hodarchaeales archaeon]
MSKTMKNALSLAKGHRNLLAVFTIYLILLGAVSVVYSFENSQTLKGTADFQLNYSFQVTNKGPLNLSSLSVRLALLKDWFPVQKVSNLTIHTEPNFTVTDEYDNYFAWYEFDEFRVNQSLDLQFDVNLTLYLLDYVGAITSFSNEYNTSSEDYRLYTSYHPLTDTNDPALKSLALNLDSTASLLDYAFNVYNFSSTYIKYKLLSTSRGASFALSQGYGDCDEYTTLFIALLRLYGIPAVEHTAWLADFEPGFVSQDAGSIAHAYPMFYLPDTGFLPTDPTRGNTNLFDNWLKTDYKRITLTRGPDQPYRLLKYRWVPQEGIGDPIVLSNYTITIKEMNIKYTSIMRP